jgi:hypothetical protein
MDFCSGMCGALAAESRRPDAVVQQIACSFTLGFLVFGLASVGSARRLKFSRSTVIGAKLGRAIDHQLRYCRALNLQRLGRFVHCRHGDA